MWLLRRYMVKAGWGFSLLLLAGTGFWVSRQPLPISSPTRVPGLKSDPASHAESHPESHPVSHAETTHEHATPEHATPEHVTPEHGETELSPAQTTHPPDVVIAEKAAPPDINQNVPLRAAPDNDVAEIKGESVLPKISESGLKPWQAYRRPFPAGDWPLIAVIITDMGLSSPDSQQAITTLPAAFTLGWNPYAPRLMEWINAARQDDHEAILAMPMQPLGWPETADAGPKSLLIPNKAAENIALLEQVLGQATGIIGVIPMMGNDFLARPESVRPIFETLAKRGLVFVDSGVANGNLTKLADEVHLDFLESSLTLDENSNPDALAAVLSSQIARARETGYAVIFAPALPALIEKLNGWAVGLAAQGVALAPVSAVIARQYGDTSPVIMSPEMLSPENHSSPDAHTETHTETREDSHGDPH